MHATRLSQAGRIAVGVIGSAAALALGGHLAFSGYFTNSALAFFAGLVLVAASLLVLGHLTFGRTIGPLGLVANTAVFFVAALIALEGGWRLLDLLRPSPAASPTWSFAEARGDPALLKQWWDRTLRIWADLLPRIARRDPAGFYPLVLIPNGSVRYLESEYRINALGFRGADFAAAKGDAYRIFVIGESTTFGATLAADDTPWPERLEGRIHERLACDRPIQLVNAGVPGWNLEHSLRRFGQEILPLGPDMVISYHGFNGFHFIFQGLPPVVAEDPPTLPERPSHLFARVEFAREVRRFNRRHRYVVGEGEAMSESELLRTAYANLYRRLIRLARRHAVTPVLLTFNMAVNEASPDEAIDFYGDAFLNARAQIVANRLHNALVSRLGEADGVIAIDSSAGLDGAFEDGFIDLVHLTEVGRKRLVANVLGEIVRVLLADERLSCRLR